MQSTPEPTPLAEPALSPESETSAKTSTEISTETSPAPPATQPRNPLHGVTLESVVTALVGHYGWEELARRIPVRCFASNPSVPSSLKFLRRTPWAREKVEGQYLLMLRDTSKGDTR